MAVRTLAQIQSDLRREKSRITNSRKDLAPGVSSFTLLRDLIDSFDNIINTNMSISEILEEVVEIERHIHSAGSWFGEAAVPVGETHVADRIGDGIQPFQLDAGNTTWGSWVQILGSSDTPARAGQLYFDPHEIVITATERAGTYFIQFARGASGDAGYAAGTYTELVFESDSVGAKAAGITRVQTGRAPAGSKLWARTLCVGENTATIDFYIGIHEYEE